MSKRFVEFYIVDVLTAIDKIRRYANGFSAAAEFVCDEKAFDAVMRELEITGEAIKHILDSEDVRHLAKPEWRIIVDFRNVIVHEYFGIDADEAFKVVKEDINTLEEEIMELIVGITDKTRLYEVLDCAIEDLYKMYRKESIDYLKGVREKLNFPECNS